MQTIVNLSTDWAENLRAQKNKVSLLDKWAAFEHAQAKNITLWYLVSMIVQGIFFLPIPALLIYYSNAPVMILFITLALFFGNIIAGMGGLGIRAILYLFAFSILAHLLMIAIFTV